MHQIDRYYQILGLKPGVSPKEIKIAYRNLVKTWHPDNFPRDPRRRYQAEEKIKAINEAYEILKHYQSDAPPTTATGRVKTVKKKVDPSRYYQKGIEKAQEGKYKQAIEELTKAILIDTNYIDAYLYRGFLYEKLGQSIRAEKDFNKATKLKIQQTAYTAEAQPAAPSAPPPRSVSSPPPWNCVGTFQKHFDVVSSIAIASDGKFFVTGSYDRTLILWQLSTGRVLRTLKGHFDRVYCVAISPDNKLIASGSSDRNVKLWKASSGQEIRTCGGWFGGHTERVLSVAFSSNKKRLFSGGGDRTVKLWQVRTGKEIRTLKGYSSAVLSLAISPDGKYFVSGGSEKALRIREINGQLIRSIRGKSGILAVTFSPDGKAIATGGFDRKIKVWDWEKGEELRTLTGHRDRVCAVAFSPDGKTLASGSWDNHIKLWDWETGEERCTLTGHRDRVCAVAFSPDGKTLVSGSADKTVKIWWADGS